MTPEEKEKKEKEERILLIWNTGLNPPDRPSSLGSIKWTDMQIKQRNQLVDRINDPAYTADEVKAFREQLAELDEDYKFVLFDLPTDQQIERQELLTIQAERANQTFIEFDTVDEDDVKDLINELTDEIVEKRVAAGLPAAQDRTENFVRDHLFLNWEIHPRSGKAIQKEIAPRIDTFPEDIYGFEVLDSVGEEFAKTPQYIKQNQKYWLGVDKAIEKGLYPSEWKSALLNRNSVTAEQAEFLLSSLGISPGDNPLELLDEVTTTWNDSYTTSLKNIKDDARVSGNTENFFGTLSIDTTKEGIDPSDIFPRIGEKEKQDQDLYREFTGKGWNFNKSIEENIKILMAEENVDFGEDILYSLNPNATNRPESLIRKFTQKSITKELGLAQRAMILEISDTPEGKAYIAAMEDPTFNPSLEESFAIYKMFKDRMGDNSQTFLSEVVGNLEAMQDMDYTEDLKDFTKREKLAKEYLSQIPGVNENYKKAEFSSLITFLTPRLFNYANFDEMKKDEELLREVIQEHQTILEGRPFSSAHDMNSISGRKAALDALLQKELTEEQYVQFQAAPEEAKNNLRAALGNYANESEALGDPDFMNMAREIIGSGAQKIIDNQADKATATRSNLNDEVQSRVFDDLRNRGIITPDSSPEFVQHLQNSVVARIVNRVAFAGGIDAAEELEPYIEQEISSAPAFDLYESDFQRQLAPTKEEVLSMAALPPGVSLSQVARPTPAFDISAFIPELQQMAFEEPELAGFIQQQMQVPGFETEWQQAAKREPRRDRGAELDLQEDRLASFQAAYDRAVASGNESLIAQAQSNLDDAQSQYDRETGAAFPVYETYTGTRYDPETQRVVEAERARVATGETATTGIQQAGFLRDEQNLKDMTKMLTTTPMTQQQFFESKLPGFQERFEASPFFTQQQQRLEKEEEVEKRRTEADERAKETQRRSRLRGGNAMAVFGRRQ